MDFSTSPSCAADGQKGPRFPGVTLYDNVRCQHRLLVEHLGVSRIALVAGWSMAGCQAYQWASQYPELVEAIVPFCASGENVSAQLRFSRGRQGGPPGRPTLGRRDLHITPGQGVESIWPRLRRLGLFADLLTATSYTNGSVSKVLRSCWSGWEQEHVQTLGCQRPHGEAIELAAIRHQCEPRLWRRSRFSIASNICAHHHHSLYAGPLSSRPKTTDWRHKTCLAPSFDPMTHRSDTASPTQETTHDSNSFSIRQSATH